MRARTGVRTRTDYGVLMAYVVGYNPSAPVGQRLAPEVRAEVALLAPVTIPVGSVDNSAIGDGAVDGRTLVNNSIGSTKLQDDAVDERVLADGAVTTAKLADDAVNHNKAGLGVPVALDVSGSPVTLTFTPCTAAEYASITTPNPNTIYFIH